MSYTMDYILLTALILIIATVFFLNLLKKNPIQNLPPVVKSWPLVGALYMLVKDPENLIMRNYQKLGSVFTIKVLGLSVTMLIGPEVSRHFYTAPDSELSQQEMFEFTVPLFGPNIGFGVSSELRRQQFQFFKKGLRPEMLRHYVILILAECQDYFSKWQDCGTIDLRHEVHQLITMTNSCCLLGNKFRRSLSDDVDSLLQELAGGVLPISFLLPYLPIPAHKRRDRARDKLNQIFSRIILSQKNSLQSEENILQTFLESKYLDGKSNTDEQVTGLSIIVLFASHFNISNTMVSMAAYLLQNNTFFLKVVEEQKNLLHRHGSKIDFDILEEMHVLHRCVKEAIRLGPGIILTPRYCKKTFTITTKEGKECTIPKGHIVATSPVIANQLDYVIKDPNKYDPDRYLSVGEKEAVQPYSDITFGGGRHRCPAEAFTYVMVKTIWSYLIRNFELDLVSSFPNGKWNRTEKILVNYRRRQLSI